MKIYEFSLNYSTNELGYVRYTESRRNNVEDLWGHLWHSTYWKKRLEEENTFCELHDYYPDGWEINQLDSAYHSIGEKYNPVVQTTESGQSYLYSEWEKLKQEFILKIKELDDKTPWSETEPKWWLDMMEVRHILETK